MGLYNFFMDTETLKAHLHYDPETGVFTRRKKWGARLAGGIIGCMSKHGYLQISVAGKCYTAQRLAWFYTHGEWPVGVVDHINRDRGDNRLCNLRCVNYSQNSLNTISVRGMSGVRGVCLMSPRNRKRSKKLWRADISVDGKRIRLGEFYLLEDAIAARKAAETRYGVVEFLNKPN